MAEVKWECEVLLNIYAEQLAAQLNDGWEVIAITEIPATEQSWSCTTYYFKRKVVADETEAG